MLQAQPAAIGIGTNDRTVEALPSRSRPGTFAALPATTSRLPVHRTFRLRLLSNFDSSIHCRRGTKPSGIPTSGGKVPQPHLHKTY